jgi:hypothetical protein
LEKALLRMNYWILSSTMDKYVVNVVTGEEFRGGKCVTLAILALKVTKWFTVDPPM